VKQTIHNVLLSRVREWSSYANENEIRRTENL